MAEQLLGVGKLRAPHITRGIYTTLPRSDEDFEPDHLHVDQHPFHLGVVGYLGDVVPNGGGFRVWPSSHQWFYYVFESQYKSERNEAYDRVRSLFESQPSLECTGGTGDIVFWHHRLAHMAGRNYSRHLRQAVLYDFTRSDLEVAQEEGSLPRTICGETGQESTRCKKTKPFWNGLSILGSDTFPQGQRFSHDCHYS